MQRHIIDYIRRPDTIDDDAIAQLQALTLEYPYFHVARILLLQALYKKHDAAYDEKFDPRIFKTAQKAHLIKVFFDSQKSLLNGFVRSMNGTQSLPDSSGIRLQCSV